MTTGFFFDERCFWHGGGNYAGMLPVGGLVQPLDGGLPESPESKRRLKNLIDVTGLSGDLSLRGAAQAGRADLLRVHPASYLDAFKDLSDQGGGEMGRRTPFGPGGYEIAALSAGLSVAALEAVLRGEVTNAYALSRPPGHHCLPDYPNGFCLMANLAIAIEAARAKGLADRFVVLDWDVHHGNGTEAIFYEDPDVLTVSIHQDRNYPMDSGHFADRGRGAGTGVNLNIPLPAGVGHAGYLAVMDQIVADQIRAFAPDVIVIACGFDAAAIDPLGRMLATADTFGQMTARVMTLADDLCAGRLMMAHEGGYSEVYVPFCGHHVLQQMSGSAITAPDPFGDVFPLRQPGPAFDTFVQTQIDAMRDAL
ncbi:class II histone deacetylase [Pseudooctadecabacter jejudonensis]|uniref:Histone deacetylase-like amidohydrolase n=1 Tax=Pseudooctadecabacter jejudonensis TaxID=1391910 RepID=A0A1Y5SR41_9RHOB|nr:class II histone deacetylase [Pseudooctadecabacter jejudonensis]SLN43394.1 Histone deacetylase-like amidohydrolase [Pseudooctadecabacter jejudonensis]